MLWFASEFFTQHWILRGNTNRTSIQMTFSHHCTAWNYRSHDINFQEFTLFCLRHLPITISGAVLNPNSSAPKSAATTTSKPVRSWPSACKITLKTWPNNMVFGREWKRTFVILAIESIARMAIWMLTKKGLLMSTARSAYPEQHKRHKQHNFSHVIIFYRNWEIRANL